MYHLNAEIVSTLDELIVLNQASELGFETAAEHAREPALKVLLRDYARQRTRFAEELRAEIIIWGGISRPRRNPLAALHRGWIDLKAGLTVGRTNETRVVLLEGLRGERHALQRYCSVLQRPLPVAVLDRLARQITIIKDVYSQLERLAECGEEIMVLQLFPDGQSARMVAGHLAQDQVSHTQVQVTPIQPDSPYACQCQRQRVLECASAGVFSGAVLGGLLGIVVGVGLLLTGEISGVFGEFVAAVVLAGGFGCLFGALVGLIIGQGVTGEDAYIYAESTQRGGAVLAVTAQSADSVPVQAYLRNWRATTLQ